MQEDRQVRVKTPLGDDKLLFRRMTAREQLSGLFEYELDLLSEDEEVKYEDLLGQLLTVTLDLPDDKERFFTGYVSRFCQTGREQGYATYEATLRPWLWFLTRTSDCRIFQEKKVPDIVKEIFREHGFSDFEEKLSGKYRKWEYCVQYRETDFNFVSRLMEQEGIYYYFTHEEGKHTLVLTDSLKGHEAFEGYDEVEYHPPSPETVREEHVSQWCITKEVQPGMYAMTDYDFEKPKANLENKSANKPGHEGDSYEIFDFPGEFIEPKDGENYAKLRLEELQAQYEEVVGATDARGLAVGHLFKLTNHPRPDQEREYLVKSAVSELRVGGYLSGETGGEQTFGCTFTAMESQRPFRPARATPKPLVQGPQTATVVGKSGEKIWTDKYGRVKLQFHWDRYGKADENSSCWVRVSSNWAGPNWGGMFLPHIGQEVIVEHLEGDPDRPLVTGRVYNADNMPPEGLPGAQTKSVIRDHGGNEIIMEGEDGKQQIRLHSPTEDTRITLGSPNEGNIFMTTAGDLIRRITGPIDTVTESDEVKHIMGDEIKKTDGKWELKIGGELNSITAGVATEQKLSAKSSITVGATHDTFIGGKLSTAHGYFHSITRGWKREINTAKVVKEEADKKVTVKAHYIFDVGATFKAKAGNAILFECGDSSILMTSSAIEIEASTVKINGKSATEFKSGGDVKLKPSGKVSIPGGKLDDGGNIKS